MKLRILMLGLAATLFAAMGGCASNKTNAEMDSLRSQNKELADQVATQNAQIDSLKTQVSSMTPSTQPEPTAPGMNGEGGVSDLTGGNIGVSPGTTGTRGRTSSRGGASTGASSVNGAGEVVIELPGDTLFDAGKATIKTSAKKTLDNVVADIKKNYSGRMLRIEGYTDPTPVKSTGWDDNWDLGFVPRPRRAEIPAEQGDSRTRHVRGILRLDAPQEHQELFARPPGGYCGGGKWQVRPSWPIVEKCKARHAQFMSVAPSFLRAARRTPVTRLFCLRSFAF